MRTNLLAIVCAGITLTGGTYLSATPPQAEDLNCWNTASAIHAMFEALVCGGEANCHFNCTNDFQQVTSMSCECV